MEGVGYDKERGLPLMTEWPSNRPSPQPAIKSQPTYSRREMQNSIPRSPQAALRGFLWFFHAPRHTAPGSGPASCPEEHKPWLGHPWQASALPASLLPVPGQSGGIRKRGTFTLEEDEEPQAEHAASF